MAMAAAMATALAVVALAIYDSPRGVCAIYEYFRKSNVCPALALLAPLPALLAYNYMEQRELRIQYCCQSAMGTKPAAFARRGQPGCPSPSAFISRLLHLMKNRT